MLIGSIEDALPSPSHSISDALEPHAALGGLEAHRQLRHEAAQDQSVRTPITESCGPVMPASVM